MKQKKPRSTGWFGIPDGKSRGTQVHVVEGGGPICGVYISERAEYQWCTHGVKWDWIECDRCRDVIAKEQIQETGWVQGRARTWLNRRKDGRAQGFCLARFSECPRCGQLPSIMMMGKRIKVRHTCNGIIIDTEERPIRRRIELADIWNDYVTAFVRKRRRRR